MAPQNTGPKQVTITAVLLALAIVFTVLRLWARLHVVANYGLDDVLLLAGLAGLCTLSGLNFGMVHWGMGQHADALSDDHLGHVLRLLYGFECVYVTALAFVKLSILAMYLRLFPIRNFKIAAYTVSFVVVGWCISVIVVSVLQCDPIEKAWKPWMTEGQCINLRGSFIGNAGPNIATDIAILAMPVGQVWRLHATMAQKVALLGTFGLGSFVLIASIYRFSTLMAFNSHDTTYTLATPCTWCVVESACGIICANLPTLRPLARKITSKFGGSSDKTKTASSNHRLTELVTIGGSQHMNNRALTKNSFHRLEEESLGDAYSRESGPDKV